MSITELESCATFLKMLNLSMLNRAVTNHPWVESQVKSSHWLVCPSQVKTIFKSSQVKSFKTNSKSSQVKSRYTAKSHQVNSDFKWLKLLNCHHCIMLQFSPLWQKEASCISFKLVLLIHIPIFRNVSKSMM